MPIEKDLKEAYTLLYDKREIEKALELYDKILGQDGNNLYANAYKSACLEKLYFRSSSWHNEETLESATDFLKKALDIAQKRCDRAKIGFVYFRFCIHYYNCKKYDLSKEYLSKCEQYGFSDDTLPLWKHNIETAYEKHKSKFKKEQPQEKPQEKPQEINVEVPAPKDTFKTDWYQSSNTVSISLFTKNLPQSKDDVNVAIKDSLLSISYQIPSTGSEFQYSVKLSHNVEPEPVQVSVFTKKIEVTLNKAEKIQWKTLEKTGNEITPPPVVPVVADVKGEPLATNNRAAELSYPSSSKKAIDWSKIDVDSDEDDPKTQSADSFFQQLYKGADEDTRRAMMKSFIESNGTSLSTNWEEVSKGKVEPALPEGVEMKKL